MSGWNFFSQKSKTTINKGENLIGLKKIKDCVGSDQSGNIVFVHGLGGHYISTWHPTGLQNDNYWLNWLHQDHPNFCIWSFGYEAEPFSWKGKTMPLFDQASNLLEWLDTENLDSKPLIFVTHSLGGLLVKKMLNAAQTYKREELIKQIKGIVFLGTPHKGSHLANLIDNIGSFTRATVSVEELKVYTPQLRELNEWYRENVRSMQIASKVYYETIATNGFLVVNEDSANPGIEGVKPVAIPENHINIAKPTSLDSLVYKGVKKFISKTFNSLDKNIHSDNN